MFVTFPAGLTIYWLVNNILSIAQQYWINRQG
jgi:YidC/Oxa1 family membrane protein insertase